MITTVTSTATPQLRPELRSLAARVRATAGETWLVGGALRDLLRGREPADLDFVTAAGAKEVSKALAEQLGGSPFPLDEERGTWRVVLPQAARAREIDISTLENGLEADLLRRDFTVDALAALVSQNGLLGEVIDPCHGLNDIESRQLRMVSEASLRDDPLRLLRAARLAVDLDLTIEPETAAAVTHLAPRLLESAAERQRDELVRMFSTPRAAAALRLMDSLGLLQVLMPELEPGRGCQQPFAHHYWDVFDHSVETVAALDRMLEGSVAYSRAASPPSKRGGWFAGVFGQGREKPDRPWLAPVFREGLSWSALNDYLDGQVGGTSRRALIKLAGLLHDVSKPETRTVEPSGRVRFFGHPEQGAAKASAICRRLRFGGRESAFVARLVEEHLRPTQLSNKGLPSSRALYRFFRDLGDAAPGVLILSLADAAAATGPRLRPERWRGHVAYVSWVLENGLAQREAVQRQPRLISGHDLIESLGLAPGPGIGRLLAAIEEAVAAGEVSSQEEALELARGMTSPSLPRVPLRARRGTDDAQSQAHSVAASNSREMSRETPEGHAVREPVRWRQWRNNPVLGEKLKLKAREMRRDAIRAEDWLWQHLRRRQLMGYQFRRQHPIDRFIVDFYCLPARLVVEVDGPIHEETANRDRERQQMLESLGIRVLRFKNEDVLNNINAVLDTIAKAVQSPTQSSPSPSTERGIEGERFGGPS